MAFGLSQYKLPTGQVAYEWQHLQRLQPDKLVVDVQAYGALLIKCLAEEGDVPQGFALPDFLGSYTTAQVRLMIT